MRSGISFALTVTFLLNCLGCFGVSRRAGTEGVSAVGLTPSEWASLSKPGPSHKLLESFAGDWDVKVTFWSDPKAKGESSAGRSKISWILGERFLQENFQGKIAGENYVGLGLIGYDNGSRTFKTVWADSLNTALTTSVGKYDPEQNSLELESQVYDPLVSGVKTVYSRIKITSPDSYTFSMLDRSPEGREFKSLEMEYSRVKE
jgi:hypothetical protein